jgi:hypothetical protein
MKTTFKVLSLTTAVLLTFAFQSCDKVKDSIFPSFENDALAIEFTIPVAPEAIDDTLELTSVHFNIDSLIKDFTGNAFSITNVNSISIKDVEWTLLDADAQNNFQNLDKASVLFHSNTVPNAIEVAAAPSIPYASTEVLSLTGIPNTNIKNYFTGSDLYLQLAVKVKTPTTKELQSRVKLNISFE